MTKIEWTEATWNPIVGCSIVSPGCTNCYAMRQAHRMASNPQTPQYHGTTQISRGGPVWTGKVALAEKALTEPLRRKKPTMYFVNSMGDLFHEDVPDDWIDQVFAVMALCPQHTFQVLTKRSARMREYMQPYCRRRADALGMAVIALGYDGPLESLRWPLPNVWLGVSAEDQARADDRIPDLLMTPAAVRFVSAEPLLGPLDFTLSAVEEGVLRPYRSRVDTLAGCCQALDYKTDDWFVLPAKIDWVIVGGESGKGARPMHPDWARSIRDHCATEGVPFFFKQAGEWTAWEFSDPPYLRNSYTTFEVDKHTWLPDNWDDATDWDDGLNMIPENRHVMFQRAGKKAAGRLLDGVTHNAMPEIGR